MSSSSSAFWVSILIYQGNLACVEGEPPTRLGDGKKRKNSAVSWPVASTVFSRFPQGLAAGAEASTLQLGPSCGWAHLSTVEHALILAGDNRKPARSGLAWTSFSVGLCCSQGTGTNSLLIIVSRLALEDWPACCMTGPLSQVETWRAPELIFTFLRSLSRARLNTLGKRGYPCPLQCHSLQQNWGSVLPRLAYGCVALDCGDLSYAL